MKKNNEVIMKYGPNEFLMPRNDTTSFQDCHSSHINPTLGQSFSTPKTVTDKYILVLV